MESANVPTVQDITYGVTPVVKGISQSAAGGINQPDVTYKVNPIVEDIKAPNVSDVYYGVKPVVDNFNPPDVSAEAIYSENAPEVTPVGAAGADGSEAAEVSGAAPAFAPQISIVVQGNMDEKATEDLKNSLYETVKELFAEFRAEELERMTLKNQYAF